MDQDSPLRRTALEESNTVKGVGLSGQAGALRHSISKALTLYGADLRSVLKRGGFLIRASRVVERKRYAVPRRAGASNTPGANLKRFIISILCGVSGFCGAACFCQSLWRDQLTVNCPIMPRSSCSRMWQ